MQFTSPEQTPWAAYKYLSPIIARSTYLSRTLIIPFIIWLMLIPNQNLAGVEMKRRIPLYDFCFINFVKMNSR